MKIILLILVAYIVLVLFCYIKDKSIKETKGINKLFEPLAKIIIKKIKIIENIMPNTKEFNSVSINRKEYLIRSTIIVMQIFFIMCCVSLITINKNIHMGNIINKPDYDKASKNLEINYMVDGEKGNLNIRLNKKVRSKEAIEKMKSDIREYIIRKFLDKNTGLDNIRQKVNFISSIPAIDGKVYWRYDNNLFDYDGKPKRLTDKDISTNIVADIQTESGYNFSEEFNINIVKTDDIEIGIREKIKEDKEKVYLPDSIQGKNITWLSEIGENGIGKIIFIIIITIIILVVRSKNIANKIKARTEELKVEYSYLVGMLVLYMETGLSISQAWLKICITYDKENYLKQELIRSKNNINNGKDIDSVFSDFAYSCSTREYRKLAQLITQNLKRGSSTILTALRQEMNSIEKEKRNLAKIAAKKAETKLLIPLVLMLMIVLVIILAPSIISFRL